MNNTNNTKAFLELVRAGLWEKEARLAPYGKVDYGEVMRLAEEQSVVGLVTAGLEHVNDVKIPQEVLLQFIGQTLQLEQRNKAMNHFIEQLVEDLQQNNIYTILVKGQGVAQCYERPLWRASGDVDLLLDRENYDKAKIFLLSKADNVEEEKLSILHLAMTISSWEVELHGKMGSGSSNRIDRVLEKVEADTLKLGGIRLWQNGKTAVHLPSSDNDIIFVFTHILRHFFNEGIGLRQVCDWCRLLRTYREEIKRYLLKERLHEMMLMSEWKGFAALAVDTLGMPAEDMPLYDNDKRWQIKAARICSFILDTGNFGHNRDNTIYSKYPKVVYKTISFCRHIGNGSQLFMIFPLDATRAWFKIIGTGIREIMKGK